MNDLYITPITTNLEKYTFRQSNQLYQQTGCIGYLRADLGSSGKEFHSTWNDTCSFFKTDEFKKEFDDVINALRLDEKYGKMLGDRTSLSKYCHDNAKQYSGEDKQYFGVRVDTDNHTYLLRLNPRQGEYNLYCYCYVKKYLETQLVQASKGIRFITPHYREIFRIPDGDKIRIIHSDGERYDKTCRYIDDYHTEVGDRLYHICEFAELMERNGRKVIPLRSSLPERCYNVLPSDGRLIIITKGESGYTDVNDSNNSSEKNKELADGHNAEMGVTKAQAEAMLSGSMFGWNTPAADPKNYNEQGTLIRPNQHERGEAR
ncbi:MAG: hypothetical protein UHM85_01535 [Acutalibacteraceae bacterium]|nr:hypothetical protein [Acutalibacteraceae bacterium]